MNLDSKKKWLGIGIAAAAAATAGLHFANRMIFSYATMKERLTEDKYYIYEWRFGRVCYTKKGEGSPVLLVHRLDWRASSREWREVMEVLTENHTVYTIDLIGCGRSEKPRITYTNYLFVQLLNDFVRDIIKSKTDMVTSGKSSSLGVMACYAEPGLYHRLIFVEPQSIAESARVPKANHKALKYVVELPVIGTLIYNLSSCKTAFCRNLRRIYGEQLCDPDGEMIQCMVEAAHLGGPSARYLYASVRSHFTDIFVGTAVRNLDHSIILIGGDNEHCRAVFDEFCTYNPAVETVFLKDCKGMPCVTDARQLAENLRIFTD